MNKWVERAETDRVLYGNEFPDRISYRRDANGHPISCLVHDAISGEPLIINAAVVAWFSGTTISSGLSRTSITFIGGQIKQVREGTDLVREVFGYADEHE